MKSGGLKKQGTHSKKVMHDIPKMEQDKLNNGEMPANVNMTARTRGKNLHEVK